MPFTVRIAFTGLGVAVIKTDKANPDTVHGVDLLLIDTESHKHMATHHHLPRLTFQIEDVVPRDALLFKGPHVGANAAPLAELDLSPAVEGGDGDADGGHHDAHPDSQPMLRRDLTFSVDPAVDPRRSEAFTITRASSSTPRSDSGLVENAIDWIPDVRKELELDDAILSPDSLEGSPYVARVRLPAGNIESRGLFVSRDGTFSSWTFGDSEERPLAEQFIWSRNGVERLHLGIDGIELDAELKQLRKAPPVVELAVTNLPREFKPKRFWAPNHFAMLNRVSASQRIPKPILPAAGGGVTHGGSCPPVKTEKS